MINPLITFIIATYNSGKTLNETIESILIQTYNKFEIIIIDGGSTDDTVQIIEKFSNKIKYWISENDRGIAHAFNKGLAVSSGDYVNFQGSGDSIYSSNALSEIFVERNFEEDFVIARINRVSAVDSKKVLWTSAKNKQPFNLESLVWRMSMHHQALFTSKGYFLKYGNFDETLKFSMDYEHLLRSFKYSPSIFSSNVIFSNWRKDGIGENRELEIFKEYNLIKCRHKIKPHLQLSIIDIFIRGKYLIKVGFGLLK
jgi:glycosyltransferase involved in cell wall biosynthesis